MPYDQASKSTDLVQSFNFHVTITWAGGSTQIDLPFDKISGIRETTGQIEWRSSGDSARNVRRLPGLTKPDNVTLDKVYAMDSSDLATIKKLHRAAQGREGLTTPYFEMTVTPHANFAQETLGKEIRFENPFNAGSLKI